MPLLALTYPDRWYIPSYHVRPGRLHRAHPNHLCLSAVNVAILRWFIVFLLFNELSIIFILYFFHSHHAYKCIVKSKVRLQAASRHNKTGSMKHKKSSHSHAFSMLSAQKNKKSKQEERRKKAENRKIREQMEREAERERIAKAKVCYNVHHIENHCNFCTLQFTMKSDEFFH